MAVPEYVVVRTSGEAHAQVFEVECRIAALAIVAWAARSRRGGGAAAAEAALGAIDAAGAAWRLSRIRLLGHVAIVGRPSVGKSTLMNALVGEKDEHHVEEAADDAHRILGIDTRGRRRPSTSTRRVPDTPSLVLNDRLNATVRERSSTST
jgi:hypothetical protein